VVLVAIEEEKRGITRVDYNLVCQMVFGGKSAQCHIHNFSLTGLLVEADDGDLPEVGERVSVVLQCFCPEIIRSEIDCDVVRVKGGSIGLKFQAIDYDTLMKLNIILSEETGSDGKIENEIVQYITGK